MQVTEETLLPNTPPPTRMPSGVQVPLVRVQRKELAALGVLSALPPHAQRADRRHKPDNSRDTPWQPAEMFSSLAQRCPYWPPRATNTHIPCVPLMVSSGRAGGRAAHLHSSVPGISSRTAQALKVLPNMLLFYLAWPPNPQRKEGKSPACSLYHDHFQNKPSSPPVGKLPARQGGGIKQAGSLESLCSCKSPWAAHPPHPKLRRTFSLCSQEKASHPEVLVTQAESNKVVSLNLHLCI